MFYAFANPAEPSPCTALSCQSETEVVGVAGVPITRMSACRSGNGTIDRAHVLPARPRIELTIWSNCYKSGQLRLCK